MKSTGSILFALLLSVNLSAQNRRLPGIPDIPGYQTLICDFHMHTVFSDGVVWPTVRVDEAWQQGLDAIAITDHLEYLPHKADIKTDFNRSWQLAKEYSANKDLIVIHGVEITKGMPPGHLNALFIKDATPVFNSDFLQAVEEAAGQGAFIMWNHPGWKAQQPDTMKWWDEHSLLLKKGWLHGIEVANYNEFYPSSIDWALDSNLTILGNSDMHDPFTECHDLFSKSHRYVTLVFATERSEGGIRDALFSGRTAAYIDSRLIGQEELLKALFKESVDIREADKSMKKYTFYNGSDLLYELALKDNLYDDWRKNISLKPGYETVIILPEETNIQDVWIQVKNMITGSSSVLGMSLSSLVNVDN